jgi:hypothetical protein
MQTDKQAQCAQCKYWSRHPRERQGVIMCAVNIPRPTADELRKQGGRTAFTWHDCPDFETEDN